MDDISNFELHDQATLKLLPRGRGMVPSGPKEPLLFRPLYLAPLGMSIPVIPPMSSDSLSPCRIQFKGIAKVTERNSGNQ